jgi:crossover junction endodeoxyribonuclease RuvC
LEKPRIIIGIDPGTNIMGYGIIEVTGSKLKLITLGVIHMNKSVDGFEKLTKIFEETSHLIEKYHATEMAIEAPFFGKNIQSMLKLGRAQGIAIAAGMRYQLKIEEYSPRKIKQSITGKGAGSKEQVAAMLERILQFKYEDKYLDATDGLAVAVCHYFQNSKSTTGDDKKSYTGWKAFLTNHPDRIKK